MIYQFKNKLEEINRDKQQLQELSEAPVQLRENRSGLYWYFFDLKTEEFLAEVKVPETDFENTMMILFELQSRFQEIFKTKVLVKNCKE